MKERWKEVLVPVQTSIQEVMQRLDASALQIVLVVGENCRLLGTVTDGDVRRGILKCLPLTDPVGNIMNSNPKVATIQESRDRAFTVMRRTGIHHLPIVDENGCLVGLETLDELIQPRIRENRIVLMAGGLGQRLHPLTADCPKPMLKVGDKPLLQTILDKFIEHGFCRFYISVNYKSDVVKGYFGNGSQWGVDIRYLEEDQNLGTAGALSLLPERPNDPLLVMNGDLLTKVNFCRLLDFHINHKAMATMCVREYDQQVPYGVVRFDKYRITGIDEKPIQRFFVNAGIYVLEANVLDYVPPSTYFNMPMLFEKMIEQQKETAVFPITEYWLDIGHMTDYQRANGEYAEFFE